MDAKRAGFTDEAELLGALVDIQHILTGDRIDPDADWLIPEALREAAEKIARAADEQIEGARHERTRQNRRAQGVAA